MHKRRPIAALFFLAAALIVAYFLLLHYWYRPTYIFVYTDNARIDGALVEVVAETRGQVVQLPYDTGSRVAKDQLIATLKGAVALSPSEGDLQKEFFDYVLAPVSGNIVSRNVIPGDAVSPGQLLLTIADLNNLWVIANIDENDIRRVQPGQRVDIHIDATDEILEGRVEHIVPSTTSIIQRGAAPSLVVGAGTQDVPVKINFKPKGDYSLYPGLSVEVTIYTDKK